MPEKYSHRERIEMIMRGEKPDRFAASAWRHFYHREAAAEGLVDAMIGFQSEFDWDFMKINPRASYHVEDWGNKLRWSCSEFQKHIKLEYAVKRLHDWDKIEPLPMTAPVLAEHLKVIRMIRKKVGPELPLLMTVFNPLGIARYLVGDTDKLKEHIDQDPGRITAALENITETFKKYSVECLNAGADGIFFATLEWASSDNMDYEDYMKYGRPYDLRILKAVQGSRFNMLHVCHTNNYLKQLSDYPVDLINWDSSHPTNPSVEQAFEFFGEKTVVAGLDDRGWLWHSRPDEIGNEIARLKEKFAGRRFIFGPSCAIAPELPYENLRALRRAL